MKHVFAAMLLGALGSAVSLNAAQPITISVYPTISQVRGTAQLKIFVERNDQNRVLSWEVDGPGYYRSSMAALDGAASPRGWFFFVRDLPEGAYDVRATVTRSNKSESVALTRMTVVAGVRR